MKKRIAILGSTGSIGRQTLEVIDNFPDAFQVVALTAHSDIQRLLAQAKRYTPDFVGIRHNGLNSKMKADLPQGTEIASGEDVNLRAVRECDIDMLVVATCGSVGLHPTLEAIERGIDIALANKEVLVKAGHLVMHKSRQKNAKILPIDSEINAIFQCLGDEDRCKVRRVLLTASGGPFRETPIERMNDVTVEEALTHPTWNMGRKVTIDSATMMNKGFEMIEVHHLFAMPIDKIEVLIHPQSLIHSMVEFVDGASFAHISPTDMRLPIQNCLTYPQRVPSPLPSLDWRQISALTFEKPDPQRFPCLECAYQAISAGGSMPAVLNAANEIAVQRFLSGEIPFLSINRILRETMNRHQTVECPDLDAIESADRWARETAKSL